MATVRLNESSVKLSLGCCKLCVWMQFLHAEQLLMTFSVLTSCNYESYVTHEV